MDLVIQGTSYSLPREKVAVTCMGRLANEFAVNMTQWFRGKNYHEEFRYAMEKGIPVVQKQVNEFPEKMTMAELVENAPAYWE